MKNKTFHPKTGSFYQNWEIIRLEESSFNIENFDRSQYKKMKKIEKIIYLFFVSVLGFIVYLSFVLENVKGINIFSGI
jgi:cell division protein FtsL